MPLWQSPSDEQGSSSAAAPVPPPPPPVVPPGSPEVVDGSPVVEVVLGISWHVPSRLMHSSKLLPSAAHVLVPSPPPRHLQKTLSPGLQRVSAVSAVDPQAPKTTEVPSSVRTTKTRID
jgi:hypothetical protein